MKNVLPAPYSPRTALNAAPPPATASSSASSAGRTAPGRRRAGQGRAGTVPRRSASMTSRRRRGETWSVTAGPRTAPRSSRLVKDDGRAVRVDAEHGVALDVQQPLDMAGRRRAARPARQPARPRPRRGPAGDPARAASASSSPRTCVVGDRHPAGHLLLCRVGSGLEHCGRPLATGAPRFRAVRAHRTGSIVGSSDRFAGSSAGLDGRGADAGAASRGWAAVREDRRVVPGAVESSRSSGQRPGRSTRPAPAAAPSRRPLSSGTAPGTRTATGTTASAGARRRGSRLSADRTAGSRPPRARRSRRAAEPFPRSRAPRRCLGRAGARGSDRLTCPGRGAGCPAGAR